MVPKFLVAEITHTKIENSEMVISTYLLFYLVVIHPYLQTMESGTTSAMLGRIPLDHGSCTKMARLRLLVKT